MGKSGSGKTTLAKMLSGYYTKSSGHVTLDKDAISHAEVASNGDLRSSADLCVYGNHLENLLLGFEGEVDEKSFLKFANKLIS